MNVKFPQKHYTGFPSSFLFFEKKKKKKKEKKKLLLISKSLGQAIETILNP